jgi:hypothetical protein
VVDLDSDAVAVDDFWRVNDRVTDSDHDSDTVIVLVGARVSDAGIVGVFDAVGVLEADEVKLIDDERVTLLVTLPEGETVLRVGVCGGVRELFSEAVAESVSVTVSVEVGVPVLDPVEVIVVLEDSVEESVLEVVTVSVVLFVDDRVEDFVVSVDRDEEKENDPTVIEGVSVIDPVSEGVNVRLLDLDAAMVGLNERLMLRVFVIRVRLTLLDFVMEDDAVNADVLEGVALGIDVENEGV